MSGSLSASPGLPLYHSNPSSRSPSPPRRLVRVTTSSTTSSYAHWTPEETAEHLNSSLTRGLSPLEAEARLLRNGPNELPHEEPEPLWLRFLQQFKEPLILLLLGSAAISFVMGNLDDAFSITLAVTIVVTVGFVQEYRSEKSLDALNKLVPHFTNLVRDIAGASGMNTLNSSQFEMKDLGSTQLSESATKASTTVLANKLVPGDLVLFATGDRIPADIRITKCSDLSIDESNLTGENEPVSKYSQALGQPMQLNGKTSTFSAAAGTVGADLRLTEQHNIAFMGTMVRSGYGQGLVIATGAETEFGSISQSLQEIESPRTPLQLSMDRLGQELSYISFAVIALIMIIGLIQGRKMLDMFTIGVSLAVAAIPEGLPIIVTVTLALGVLRMANRGAIVRRLPSVETLGSVNVICSDKTGTLTMNHMAITKMWHFDVEAPFDVSKDSEMLASSPASRNILRIGNIANNGRLSSVNANSPATASSAAVLSSTMDHSSSSVRSRWVGQPTDVAILDLLDVFGEEDLREHLCARVAETPFSSERKWMGVVIGSIDAEGSDMAYIKGSLEQTMQRCDTYVENGREIVLDEPRRQAAKQAAEAMARDGLRVLAFASGPVRVQKRRFSSGRSSASSMEKHQLRKDEDLYTRLVFGGLVGMNDPPRKDVHKSIRRLMMGGVKVIMITGDAETTAAAIADKLGMAINRSPNSRSILRGEDIDHMSITQLAQTTANTAIFARTSPEHKMKIVRALQSRGDVVAMTGDGVNDAPALKKADIGISMGRLGTDVAKEAADMILSDDDFSTILRAIEQGKSIFYNIQNFITFQLSTSVAALSLVLLSTAFGFKNPLNAMQILWISKCYIYIPFDRPLITDRHPYGWPSGAVSWGGAR